MLKRSIAAVTIGIVLLIGWALSAAPRAPERPVAGRVIAAQRPSRADHPASTSARRAGRRRTHSRIDRRAAAPRRIQIPAIGVSAPIVALGLNSDGTIQTPRVWTETGWYKPGPEPGERGPAVVVGHIDSTTGAAVFYRLRALRPRDLIRIRRSDGSTVRFRVQRVEEWPKAEFPSRRVYGPTRGSVLRLVTCAGNFDSSTGHYVDNTIVYASRV
jgi:sortase (surface protein transpeptidase)